MKKYQSGLPARQLVRQHQSLVVGKQALQAGQALLLVILVMVVALTVGLSVAVRTTSNLRTSSEDENSQRAFSAAEAGIEQTLNTHADISDTALSNNSSYSTTISTLSGTEFVLNNGTTILKDEPVDLWLSTPPSYTSPWTGTLTINWGQATDTCDSNEASNTQAALEIVLISGSKATPKVTEYLFDPCSARASSNKFIYSPTSGDQVSGKNFAYKNSINITSGLIARIIPLYAPSPIGVKGGTSLPAQGTIVTSIGKADNTQRKIVSFRGYPKLPTELFPFIFFSPKR